MSQSFIRLSEVQRRTGYSKAWIYRLIKEQRFPQSVKIEADQLRLLKVKLKNGLISASLSRVAR